MPERQTRQSRSPKQEKVLIALEEHGPGRVYSVRLQEATGLPRDDVLKAMYAIGLKNLANITKEANGVWLYSAEAKVSSSASAAVAPVEKLLFEQVAVLPSGARVLVGEDGKVYRATEME